MKMYYKIMVKILIFFYINILYKYFKYSKGFIKIHCDVD